MAIIILIFTSLILFSCEKYEGINYESIVDGLVIEKKFIPASTDLLIVPSGNSLTAVPTTSPAQFKVTVMYQNLKTTVESKELFDSKNEGDIVRVLYYTSIDGESQGIEYSKEVKQNK